LRPKCGGLKGDQVKRLKELETENKRLRRAVSDLTLVADAGYCPGEGAPMTTLTMRLVKGDLGGRPGSNFIQT
jgi:hypothetical protein